MPWLYQSLSFVLKSPIATSKYGLLIIFSNINSNSVKMTKNHLEFDLEIYNEQQNGKTLSPIFNSKFIHSSRRLISQTLKGRKFL